MISDTESAGVDIKLIRTVVVSLRPVVDWTFSGALFCHFRWRVRLIGGMSRTECWMTFEFTVDAKNYWVGSEINMESKKREKKIKKLCVGETNWVVYLLALKTCGTKQQSASVTSSPTQYFPALVESNFSTALKPLVIQCCAHSFFFSSPTWINTMRFWSGWIPDAMTSQSSLTLARLWKSWGSNARCGRVSSKYCMIDIDSINVWPSIWSDGTCSMGFTSLYSLQCCSPPDLIRLMGLMSYGISLRFKHMRTRHEHDDRQYE